MNASKRRPVVLVVEDDAAMRRRIVSQFRSETSLGVIEADGLATARVLLENKIVVFDAILCDLHFTPPARDLSRNLSDGLDLLALARDLRPELRMYVLSVDSEDTTERRRAEQFGVRIAGWFPKLAPLASEEFWSSIESDLMVPATGQDGLPRMPLRESAAARLDRKLAAYEERSMSGTINVFISHIHEEAPLGTVIKDWIEDAFRGSAVRAFLSSDQGDLPSGKKWLDVIEDTMGRSCALVSLISPLAIGRPWINIELGAAWIRKLPVIPFYHSGLTSTGLPRPFQDFNGVSLESPDAAPRLIGGLADILGLGHPKKLPFEKFRAEMLASLNPRGVANRWGVSITTPTEGQIVSGKLTVRGAITEPLPLGHSLRVLRSHPNNGAVAPGGRVNVLGQEWEALDVDVGGDPGQPRGIEAWVVGPDGEALLRSWEDSARVHYDVNERLREVSGAFGKWLPYIQLTTRDMVRCARIVVTRRQNS